MNSRRGLAVLGIGLVVPWAAWSAAWWHVSHRSSATCLLQPASLVVLDLGGVAVTAPRLDTEALRECGYAGADSRRWSSLLFSFDVPSDVAFWQSGVSDATVTVAWLRRGKVIASAQMPPCRSTRCPLYRPDDVADSAVELLGPVAVPRGLPVSVLQG